MKLGMLWFDNDKDTTLPDKISKAAAYYRTKYGETPNIVFTNPKTLGETIPAVPGFTVKATRSIMPNHLWMGVE